MSVLRDETYRSNSLRGKISIEHCERIVRITDGAVRIGCIFIRLYLPVHYVFLKSNTFVGMHLKVRWNEEVVISKVPGTSRLSYVGAYLYQVPGN